MQLRKDELIKSARRGSIASRVGAIEKLASDKSARAQKAILHNLNHRNALVRRTAVRALKGRDIQVAWPLVHRLRDGDIRVRIEAIATLLSLPEDPLIHYALVKSLKDPSRKVRVAALNGLRGQGLP